MIRSTTIFYDVIRKHELSPTSFMVADLIYKYTTSDGYCKETLSNISFEINTSSRSVTRCVQNLIEKGIIENIGNKTSPKYRTTRLWFDLVVSENGGEVNKENYKEVAEYVIEYINHKYHKRYVASTYYQRFKNITKKTFNGDKVHAQLMCDVFDYCKNTWSEKYQSSITPETIFGNKFLSKYLIQYNEFMLNNDTYIKSRKNVAII